MTEAHPMKLTTIVCDYPFTEEDILRHIYKTKKPSEDATGRQEPTIGSLNDPKEAETLSNRDQSPA